MAYELDELKTYAGNEIKISDTITVYQPTLGEIKDFGEQNYFSAVKIITSVGADLKWQLFDLGYDYMAIKDYELFVRYISQLISSRKNLLNEIPFEERNKLTEDDLKEYNYNPMSLLLKGLDFADYVPLKVEYPNTNKIDVLLYNKKTNSTIDRVIYHKLIDTIRDIHGFKRNNEIPANEQTKMDMIEDARDEYLASQNQPYKSMLKPLISTMINLEGFNYDHDTIWNIKINAFLDDVKRQNKILDAHYLLQGAYSGFANLKGINKERFDCFGTLK